MKQVDKKAPPKPTQARPQAAEGHAKKSELRSVDFDAGAAMLKPGGPGKQASAGKSGAGPGKASDGAIADKLPSAVDLQAARMSFTIPGQRTFAETWQYTAQTTWPTTISLEVTPAGLSVATSPGLYFDATWPAQNMNMHSAGIDFASGKPYADFRVVRGAGEGFLDFSEKGEKAVVDMISRAIAGTAMAKPGYNPMKDKDLMATLAKVKANFDAMPAVPGTKADAVGAADVSAPTLGATLGMKSPFTKSSGEAGLSIPGGGVFDVSISGTGNLASILKAGSKPQAAAMAAGISSVVVTSEAMTLIRPNGKPLARLQQLTVHKGGSVTLDRFELLGGLGTGAGVESLIRLVAILAAAEGGGAMGAMQAERAVANGGADPVFVKGLSKSMIETGLSDAVRALFRENRNAIPGLDLGLAFGVK